MSCKWRVKERTAVQWNDSDAENREQWRKIPCSGEIPTPDEWLRYVVEKMRLFGYNEKDSV